MTMELKERLEHIFSHDYPGREAFVDDIIKPIFGDDIETVDSDLARAPEYADRAKKAGIKHIHYIGNLTEEKYNTDNIVLLDVTVDDSKNIERSRVNIQQLIRSIVQQHQHLLIVFHYENVAGTPWRLSYAYKAGSIADTTSAKRYTYVFGQGFRGRTAAERFDVLANSPRRTQDFIDAFSVEALSNDFFDEYRAFYAVFVEHITHELYTKDKELKKLFSSFKWRAKDTSTQFQDTFGNDAKQVRDYIKKMFGRIVFLYFLQRKGWLYDNDGNPNPHYMHDLFYKSDCKDNFLDGCLATLFFRILNTDIASRGEDANKLPGGYFIPYLNGGLFEEDDIDKLNCVFPARYFQELFDFLDRYNFTIDENDQEDSEIGIDPEMLGRIFENLLEDNKDKGAYYTPREVVDYMCRESIVAYLVVNSANIDKVTIRAFVTTQNITLLNEEQRNEIERLLLGVKICDPAIGSGAFPMGLVNLLAKLFISLRTYSSINQAKMKRYIMQNSIYGVDIEKGAVDIARLRFWLAMVVDETEPTPLPNLGFKIMQGNSLQEWYHGVDLASLMKKENGQIDFISDSQRALLRNDVNKFYSETDHNQRARTLTSIKGLVVNMIHNANSDVNLVGIDVTGNQEFYMWHTWFSDVFDNGGFDIVIGNPPYGAKLTSTQKEFFKNNYVTAKTKKGLQKGSIDTYTLFIELAHGLLKPQGFLTYIVPISFTASDSLSGVHRLIFNDCSFVKVSSFAVRPKPVFQNAVVNSSIIEILKTGEPCKGVYATKMHRKSNKHNLADLLANMRFINVSKFLYWGHIPKISDTIEGKILSAINLHPTLGSYLRTYGKKIYYRFAGGRYFKVVTNYSTGSSAERPLFFDESIADAIGCILSSSLAFWYYQIYSDNLNWKSREIESFPIPKLTKEQIDFLSSLYQDYLEDIEANANIRTSEANNTYKVDAFKEYKIGKSKHIIDKIDDFIAPIYGLSSDQLEFIKNYEISFRVSDSDENDD